MVSLSGGIFFLVLIPCVITWLWPIPDAFFGHPNHWHKTVPLCYVRKMVKILIYNLICVENHNIYIFSKSWINISHNKFERRRYLYSWMRY